MSNAVSRLQAIHAYNTPGLTDAVRVIENKIREAHSEAQRRVADVDSRFDLFEDEGRRAQQRSERAPHAGLAQGANNAAEHVASLSNLLHVIDEARRGEASRRLAGEQRDTEANRLKELMA